MRIETVCCDTLEFEVKILNKDGTPFVFEPGDEVWFTVKRDYSDPNPLLEVSQADPHFCITNITPELPAGDYMFELGLTFANGKVKTLVPARDGKLVVLKKLKGHHYD